MRTPDAKPTRPTLQIAAIAFVVVAIAGGLIRWGYWVDWTGFDGYIIDPQYQRGKTLWDWFDLLVLPLVLVAVPLVYETWVRRREQEAAARAAEDDYRQKAFDAFSDRLSVLLMDRGLGQSAPGALERQEAESSVNRTLKKLARDPQRKADLVKLLYERNLINVGDPIINLDGADLSEVDLSFFELVNIGLKGVNLTGGNLEEAFLENADLSGATLTDAKLNGAHFYWANLKHASLKGASLEQASLHNATLTWAKLVDAHLKEAICDGANLEYADLTGADLTETSFGLSYVGGDAPKSPYDMPLDMPLDMDMLGATDMRQRRTSLLHATVSEAQLASADTLWGAILPDGTRHPEDISNKFAKKT